MRLKVWVGNYDGRQQAMVAAKNQREAAKALGTTVYDLRQYYESHPPVEDDEIAASLEPRTVWLRPFLSKDDWTRRPTLRDDT